MKFDVSLCWHSSKVWLHLFQDNRASVLLMQKMVARINIKEKPISHHMGNPSKHVQSKSVTLIVFNNTTECFHLKEKKNSLLGTIIKGINAIDSFVCYKSYLKWSQNWFEGLWPVSFKTLKQLRPLPSSSFECAGNWNAMGSCLKLLHRVSQMLTFSFLLALSVCVVGL